MAAAALPPPSAEQPVVVKTTTEVERDVVIVDVEPDDKTKSSTTSFNVEWKNPETGKVLVGTFTAKRPSLGVLGQIAVYKAKLNGGERVADYADRLHQMIADFQFVLVSAPDWWKPAEFFDHAPLTEVHRHLEVWLNSFRGAGVGK